MIIALLTDFGDSEYVAILKAVIYSNLPQATIVDIKHSIPSQNILNGAWILQKSVPWFAQSTIFVAIVDPGVGSMRRALAIKTQNYFFIGPDNGLLIPAAINDTITEILVIPLPQTSSSTFHGRDIFVPAAVNLMKSGWKWCTEHWDVVSEYQSLSLKVDPKKPMEGIIVDIDHYGNIITNIPVQSTPIARSFNVFLNAARKDQKLVKLSFVRTYQEGFEAHLPLVLLEGSANTFEIAAPNGSAAHKFPVSIGNTIHIQPSEVS